MNHNWFDWGVIQTFLWNKTLKGKGEFFRKTWKYFRILNILKRKNSTKPSKEKFGIGELKKMANYLRHQSLSLRFFGRVTRIALINLLNIYKIPLFFWKTSMNKLLYNSCFFLREKLKKKNFPLTRRKKNLVLLKRKNRKKHWEEIKTRLDLQLLYLQIHFEDKLQPFCGLKFLCKIIVSGFWSVIFFQGFSGPPQRIIKP